MMSKYIQWTVVIALCVLLENKVFSFVSDEESCVSYGPGGQSNIYPLGSKSEGHQLQYTKAVSK